MALRIAGAGKQVGLSEAQVLAYSSALASVGIEAEAGGSAISRAFITVADASRNGGRSLDLFAKVAGMSSGSFAKAFRTDASGAMLTFIEGLGRMKKDGGDVFGTLEKLRLGEIRVRDALLRASGAGRLFHDQIRTGNAAWRENTALTREANQRYRTAAARFQVLKNRVIDWGISIGQKLLPPLTRMMDILSDDRLTSEEKFDRLSRLIGPLISRGVEEAVRIAGQAGPKIVAALGSGIAVAWTDMSPMAKLFTVGGIIAAVGGRKALVAAGIGIGRILGGGIAAGAATGVGAGAGGGAAGGVAGGAAAGGIMASLRAGLMVAAKRAGWIGVALTVADGLMTEIGDRVGERSSDLRKALESAANRTLGERMTVPFYRPDKAFGDDAESGAGKTALAILDQLRGKRVQLNAAQIQEFATKARSLELDRASRAQVERIVALLREGSRLRIGVNLGDVDRTKQLVTFRRNLEFLRSGTGTTMADILKVSRRNMNLIEGTWGKGTRRTRELAAMNMRGTAEAIRLQMQRSGNFTRAGLERMEQLIRNAKLINPTRRQAQNFGQAWADGFVRARKVTQKGIDDMIAEARKMPGPMRRSALEAFGVVIRAARDSGRLTKEEYRTLRSRIGAEWAGIRTDGSTQASRMARSVVGSFASMINRSADGMGIMGSNVNRMLGAFGQARALTFDLKKIRAQARQTGGVIVPGQGSGDKVHAMLEPGEVVWNRKAVAAMGGAAKANSVNKRIPRFQRGGIAGAVAAIDQVDDAHFPISGEAATTLAPLASAHSTARDSSLTCCSTRASTSPR
jgi:hypothetical protein